jgi:hypothetical protein
LVRSRIPASSDLENNPSYPTPKLSHRKERGGKPEQPLDHANLGRQIGVAE